MKQNLDFDKKSCIFTTERQKGVNTGDSTAFFRMQKAKTVGRKEKTEAGSVFSNGWVIFSIVGSEIAEEAENYNKT